MKNYIDSLTLFNYQLNYNFVIFSPHSARESGNWE